MTAYRLMAAASLSMCLLAFPKILRADESVMSKPLADYVNSITTSFDEIPAQRRAVLQPLVNFLAAQLKVGKPAELNAICTANSRRSQLTQTWAHTAARYYGLDAVKAHSSGTQATACNARTVAALERAGFMIDMTKIGENPVYELRLVEGGVALTLWSKEIDDASNPTGDFAALMCCSAAAEACPLVPGATLRVPLLYDDPKEADDTPAEKATYDERCEQIAREMFWVMSQVAQAE